MINNKSIYSCFFPTKTIFIDDNKEFLDGLSLNFSSEAQSYQYFTNTKEALRIINENEKEFYWYKKYLNNLEEDELEKKILEFNIQDFHKQIYNKNRFNIITTVIIDYDMPEMDGISFCKQINNPNIFKVMLTGAADNDLAVEAFNRGIIQAFVPKQDENVYEALEGYIKKGRDSYFNKTSDVIFMSLEKEQHNIFMKNKDFLSFFRKMFKEKKVSEFYLSEGTGSYILVNKEGEIDILYLLPEEHVDQLYEEAQDSNLGTKELSSLRNKEKIICSLDLANKTKSLEKILISSLEKAEPITIGREKYYYAYKHNVPISSSILTFNQFLQKK